MYVYKMVLDATGMGSRGRGIEVIYRFTFRDMQPCEFNGLFIVLMTLHFYFIFCSFGIAI